MAGASTHDRGGIGSRASPACVPGAGARAVSVGVARGRPPSEAPQDAVRHEQDRRDQHGADDGLAEHGVVAGGERYSSSVMIVTDRRPRPVAVPRHRTLISTTVSGTVIENTRRPSQMNIA
jgi:hypothetical protein